MAKKEVEEKTITNINELVKIYEEIKKETGCFVMIGVPVPDDSRVNFRTSMWLNGQVSQPNVICHRRRSRFCSVAYHAIIEGVLTTMPFVTHILLMDADEWPIDKNAVQYMLELDKDVVVGPTPILKEGKGISWNVNKYSEYCEGYWPDFIKWEDLPSEPFRVNFSGGPWLIKREVLEKLEYPYFKDIFDKVKRVAGQDIYFDRKVEENGFEIWCAPKAKFNHERNINLYQAMKFRDDTDTHGLNWGSYAISEEDWKLIKKTVENFDVENVLEFGSGLSTLLFADLGLKIESLDEDLNYALRRVRSRNKSKKIKLKEWDGKEYKPDRKHYHLCFVDGPKGKANDGIGRKDSIRIASEYSDLVIIHDAARDDETKWQKKYLKPKFSLLESNDKCAVWMRK